MAAQPLSRWAGLLMYSTIRQNPIYGRHCRDAPGWSVAEGVLQKGAPMEGLDYWRLCDELSIIQAALLIVGVDPAANQEWIANWSPDQRPAGYDASLAALTHAILAGRLKATIRKSASYRGYNEEPAEDESIGIDERGHQIIYKDNPDWSLTTVTVDDLQSWLRSRGSRRGSFSQGELNRLTI